MLYVRAYALETPSPMKRLTLAALLVLAPATASAQESALEGLRAAGSDPASLVRLGRALRRAGRFDEALRTLGPAARTPASREAAQWEMARVRFDQGDFRPAQAACNAMPAGPRRRVCLARAYLVWQRVALAQRELGPAAAALPNDGELLLARADAERLGSNVAASEASYRAAAAALPDRAEPHLGLGQLFELAQRPDDALAAYRRAVEVDSTDPAAALVLGRCLLRQRRDAAAAEPLLRRACQDRPGWPEALVAHGESLLGVGRPEEALARYQEAVRRAPTQPGAQAGLGRSLAALGRWQEAEAPLREGIRQVGNDAVAYAALADVLEHTDRATEAMETWDGVIDRAPGDMNARLRAAQLAHRTQQNSLARAYLDRVLQAEPRRAAALVLRGIIAAEEGNRTLAREAFEAALAGEGEIDRADVTQRLQSLDQPQRSRRR